MSHRFDYVVVGGGIMGGLVARGLVYGGASVALLEAGKIASGASGGHGTRGMRASQRDIREMPLAGRSYGLWRELAGRLQLDHVYRQDGLLSLDVDGSRSSLGASGRQLTADLQNAFGIRTEVLTAEQVRTMAPGVSPTVTGALYTPDDGSADHTALTRAVAESVVQAGGELREGTAVTALEDRSDGSVQVHCADGTDIVGSQGVVLAVNVEAAPIVERSCGIRLPIVPFAPMYAILELAEDYHVMPVLEHPAHSVVVKRLDRRTIMLSGGQRAMWDEATATSSVPLGAVGTNLANLARVLPELRDVVVRHVDGSRAEAMTYDAIPIVDMLPLAGRVLVATGFSGHGFMIAPAVAEDIAAWMAKGERPEALAPFSLNRFHLG